MIDWRHRVQQMLIKSNAKKRNINYTWGSKIAELAEVGTNDALHLARCSFFFCLVAKLAFSLSSLLAKRQIRCFFTSDFSMSVLCLQKDAKPIKSMKNPDYLGKSAMEWANETPALQFSSRYLYSNVVGADPYGCEKRHEHLNSTYRM